MAEVLKGDGTQKHTTGSLHTLTSSSADLAWDEADFAKWFNDQPTTTRLLADRRKKRVLVREGLIGVFLHLLMLCRVDCEMRLIKGVL